MNKTSFTLVLALLLMLIAGTSYSARQGESTTPVHPDTWRTFENLLSTIHQAEQAKLVAEALALAL